MFCSLKKFIEFFFGPRSRFIGNTKKLSLLKRFCRSSSDGISSLHGSHHVAQKLTRRRLPSKSFKVNLLPFSSSNVLENPDFLEIINSSAVSVQIYKGLQIVKIMAYTIKKLLLKKNFLINIKTIN
ncbi:uncharacterized protein METZ01_LOCUS64804 [marine metagenome]|uniref:Uncharacterized protein n=1 Tax=marine metagenome TaxID=408172 RepID=A0A381T6Y6_9ZZZZ